MFMCGCITSIYTSITSRGNESHYMMFLYLKLRLKHHLARIYSILFFDTPHDIRICMLNIQLYQPLTKIYSVHVFLLRLSLHSCENKSSGLDCFIRYSSNHGRGALKLNLHWTPFFGEVWDAYLEVPTNSEQNPTCAYTVHMCKLSLDGYASSWTHHSIKYELQWPMLTKCAIFRHMCSWIAYQN